MISTSPMPIAPNSITSGRCYRTRFGALRRVTKIERGEVLYVASMKTDGGGVSHTSIPQRTTLERFAAEAAEEVRCE